MLSTSHPELSFKAAHARIVLLVAIIAFFAQGWFHAGALFAFNEEVVGHAALPATELSVTGDVVRQDGICDGDVWLPFSTGGDPHWVLCAGGLAWPVLVNPYIGGIHYWPLQLLRPLHQGNPIWLRRTALMVGVLALVVLFFLVERLAGPLSAATSVIVLAAFPAVVLMHSVLLFFELVPALLVACTALVIVQRPDPDLPPTPLRAAVAGAVGGLAVLASIKAAVMGAPLLALALFESPALRRTSQSAWAAAIAMGCLMMSPMLIAAVIDPSSGFGNQVGFRLAFIASRLSPGVLAAEVFNALVCAADLRYHMDSAGIGRAVSLWPVTLVVPAIALVYSTMALVRALRGLPHDVVAAAAGAVQLFFILFVWLAYSQPGGNYLAIGYAQAVAAGCVVAAAGRFAAQRGFGNPLAAVFVAALLTITPLLANIYRRGDPRNVIISTNIESERQLGAYLQRTPGGPLMVTSNNLVGIPNAFTGQPEIRMDHALKPCQDQPNTEECARDVFVTVIKAMPTARFLVPLALGAYDKGWEHHIRETIEAATTVLGAQLREEANFTTLEGVPVSALYVVERAK